MIDTSMFDKILFNLLSNAFKATSENGKIRVKVSHHNQGLVFPLIDENNVQSGFEFDITDTGIGINKKNINKIFNRFIKVKKIMNSITWDRNRFRSCQEICRYHKGKIVVQVNRCWNNF